MRMDEAALRHGGKRRRARTAIWRGWEQHAGVGRHVDGMSRQRRAASGIVHTAQLRARRFCADHLDRRVNAGQALEPEHLLAEGEGEAPLTIRAIGNVSRRWRPTAAFIGLRPVSSHEVSGAFRRSGSNASRPRAYAADSRPRRQSPLAAGQLGLTRTSTVTRKRPAGRSGAQTGVSIATSQ
jgi:hypothetical protein